MSITQDLSSSRRMMVDTQIKTFGVVNQRVLASFLNVPRELFLPHEIEPLAYSDKLLNIPCNTSGVRAVLSPFILARMLQEVDIQPSERVLDVAGGWGYTAAIMTGLTSPENIVALEADAAYAGHLQQACEKLGLDTLKCVTDQLEAPTRIEGLFDVIFVNGLSERKPEHLTELLREGGRLIVIQSEQEGVLGQPQLGRCTLYKKVDGFLGAWASFNATSPCLPGFEQAKVFAF